MLTEVKKVTSRVMGWDSRRKIKARGRSVFTDRTWRYVKDERNDEHKTNVWLYGGAIVSSKKKVVKDIAST